MKREEPTALWLFMHKHVMPVFIVLNLALGILYLVYLTKLTEYENFPFWNPILNFTVVGILAITHGHDSEYKSYIERKRRNGK